MNYNDGCIQLVKDHPTENFKFLYADAFVARNLDKFFGLTKVPAFLVFKNGALHY